MPCVFITGASDFLFLHENKHCWYSLAVPQEDISNEYEQRKFSPKNKKNINTSLIKKLAESGAILNAKPNLKQF